MSLLAEALRSTPGRVDVAAETRIATSVAVAEWSYSHAERVRAEVWLGGSEYGRLSAG